MEYLTRIEITSDNYITEGERIELETTVYHYLKDRSIKIKKIESDIFSPGERSV